MSEAPGRRVVVLAGASGSGKSRLAAVLARDLGITVLHLDDFYRDGDDPALPRAHGIVDWDDSACFDAQAAVRAVLALVEHGQADVPVYDIPSSRAVGRVRLQARSPLVVVEGIFAAELIAPLAAAGLLADAVALSHPPVLTFVRRLARDLREGRKPPLVLLRRGAALLRSEPALRRRHAALGAAPCSPRAARARIRSLHEVVRGRGSSAQSSGA